MGKTCVRTVVQVKRLKKIGEWELRPRVVAQGKKLKGILGGTELKCFNCIVAFFHRSLEYLIYKQLKLAVPNLFMGTF